MATTHTVTSHRAAAPAVVKIAASPPFTPTDHRPRALWPSPLPNAIHFFLSMS